MDVPAVPLVLILSVAAPAIAIILRTLRHR